jgi:hypothetical protein
MTSNRTALIVLAMMAGVTGCSASGSSGAASADSTGKAAVSSDSASVDTAITVTAAGYGPLMIGMTVSEAATALHSQTPSMSGANADCSYVHFANQPSGMRVMVVHDTVARIDIDSTNIATGLGARIGDTESRIHQLYGSRVVVQPHKYDSAGHYLIVNRVAGGDSSLKLVFETNGASVTEYRSGRMPEVEFVEGCS